ncbi:MAG: hypothetical protein ACR2PO_08255 [Methyloligellaceae bacterium]
MHDTVLWVSVALLLLLIAIFGVVIRASTRSTTPGAAQAVIGKARTPLLWGLLIFGAIVVYGTMTPWPHAAPAGNEKPIVVSVTGAQWSWQANRKDVPAGKPIVFAVTSTDVNHGMGLYDSDYRLLTQVQGMPGYVNRVHYTFRKPGTYRLLCLEYCGLSHHEMIGELKVTAK